MSDDLSLRLIPGKSSFSIATRSCSTRALSLASVIWFGPLTPERSLVSRLFHRPDEAVVRDLMSRGATREEARRAAKAMKTPEGAAGYLAAHRELCDLTHPCESPDQCWEYHGKPRRSASVATPSASGYAAGSGVASGSRSRRQTTGGLEEKDEAVLYLASHGFSERTAASALAFCAGDRDAALSALEHTRHTRVVPECSHCIAHPPAQDLDAGPYAGANVPNAANAVTDEPAPPEQDADELPQYSSAREYNRERRREQREEERIEALIRQHHQRGKKNRENWGKTCPSSQIVAARARLMFNPRARWDDLLY